MVRPYHIFAAAVSFFLCLPSGVDSASALPEANVCFFGGYPSPAGFAYVSYLQPRYTNVKLKPVVVGVQNSSVPYEQRRDMLREHLMAKQCTVVVDSGGNWNYTLYRSLRAEPGMPLWVESEWGKSYYGTEEDADTFPALRMWARPEDQTVTAINTALALGWKDVVIVSTNRTGDNVTLAAVTEQAQHEGLRVHHTFVQGEPGTETTEALISKISAESPTRAILTATADTSVIQALVDSPRGLVPIVPLDKKTDFYIRASLGILAPQEIELTAPHQWEHHWQNFTNMTELWELFQITQPSPSDEYYFTNTSHIYMDDVEAVAAALAVINAYYNGSTAATPAPTAQQLLQASRGLEVELFTRIVRIANHSAATFAPPRTLEVVLTQPPKVSLSYTWKVIANVSMDGTTWRTDETLQWPAVGKMKGIVDPLFPVPVPPVTTPNWALIGVMAVLALLLVVAAITTAAYFVSRWARLRHCPKTEDEPFTAFFVSTHNEDEIRDLYGYKAHEIFGAVRSIVTAAAGSNRCYIARRLDAHYLLVAKDPHDAVACAAEVVTHTAKLTARAPPRPKKTIRKANTGTPSSGPYTATARSDGTKHSGGNTSDRSGRSARSARARAVTAGVAASQARRAGMTPHIAVGMSRGVGRIEFEDGAFSYAGEPVDVAAAVADFAVPNQILATFEVTQGLAQDGPIAARFEEYCEREFGRGRCAENYELLEYVADGCPRADPELAEAAREGKSDGSGGVGALSAALQASSGGLVTRSVAVAAVLVPELNSRSTDSAAIGRVQEVFDIVAAAADDCRGIFAALHDGWCVVTVNGTGGVAQAPMRATSAAAAAVDTLRDAGFAATAGVAAGPTIAGGIAHASAAARHVTSGGTAERARLLALGASLNSTAVLVTETVKREAESSFEFAASDIVAVRAPPPPKVTTAPPAALKHKASALSVPSSPPGKPERSTTPVEEFSLRPTDVDPSSSLTADVTLFAKKAESDPAPAFRTLKVFSVVGVSTAADVQDEWMYQLASAGAGPVARINAAFELIAEGAVAEAKAKLTEAAAALALHDTPAVAAMDDEGQAAVKAAAARGDAICAVLKGGGDDHAAALSELALERTRDFARCGL